MRWRRAIAGGLGLAAVAAGCGVDTGIRGVPVIPPPAKFYLHGSAADTQLGRRMPGLWREDRVGLAHYYWFRADGTGERLRRTLDPAGPREPVAAAFIWKAVADRLEVKFEDEPGAYVLQLVTDDRDADMLTLTSPWADETAWYGCASGRIPQEYVAICEL